MTTDEARALADWIDDPLGSKPLRAAARVLREQADQIDRLADSETSWRIIVSDRDNEIDRLHATIAALLAVPDEFGRDFDVTDQNGHTAFVLRHVRVRMAAVVGGGE